MNTDQAYVDGRDAFPAPVSTNPFSPLTQPRLFDAWIIGWLDRRDAKKSPQQAKRKARY